MTFFHGNSGHSSEALKSVDGAVHNLETGMRGGFDYHAVYQEIGAMHGRDMRGGVLDAGLFRRQVDEMDWRFHQDGFLPHLHIRLDQGCTPLIVPDAGYGPIPRAHSNFGPFHLGHYLHRPHHQHLPPELVICADGAGSTAGQQAACNAAQAGGYEVAADTPAGVNSQAFNPAGFNPGAFNSVAESQPASPFQLASYSEGGASGANLPDVNITDGGALPGGLADRTYTGGGQTEIPASVPLQPPGGQGPTDQPVAPANQPLVPGDQPGSDAPPQAASPEAAPAVVPVAKVPDSQLTISGAPTITPDKIDEVLRAYHSPAAGMGQYVYDQGIKHGINPAMALAFYCVESQCGTKGLAVQNKSWGNVRGHGPHGYRPYDSIKESLDKWYDMMVNLYRDKFHADKLGKVISHYAPNSDGNNEAAYIHSVGQMVRKWDC